MSPREFARFFQEHMRCRLDDDVTRIAWRYL
jgi:hypothetical protein